MKRGREGLTEICMHVKRLSEYEEAFDLVTKEFLAVVTVLAERLGDEATLKLLREAKGRLGKKTLKKRN